MKEIKISKEKLRRLYWKQGLSTYKIARIYDCNPKTIYHKLRKYNLKTRQIKKVDIPKKELYHLYYIKKLPLSKIAKKFLCNKVTVFERMKKYKLPSRTMSQAKTIFPKKDFSKNLIEKAYLIGFRLGDLNIFKDGCLIYMQSNTTKIEQAKLIKKLFQKYSNISIRKYGKIFRLQTGLNNSFSFLLPKKDAVTRWILDNKKYFSAFLAGYVDAEGNIGVYSNKARVRIRSYDKNILNQIHKKLKSVKIYSICRLETPAGVHNQNQDCWCLSINRKKDILKLFRLVEPQLKHSKRKTDLKTAKNHIFSIQSDA